MNEHTYSGRAIIAALATAPCGTFSMISLLVHLWGVDPHPFANLAIKAYKAPRTAECFKW